MKNTVETAQLIVPNGKRREKGKLARFYITASTDIMAEVKRLKGMLTDEAKKRKRGSDLARGKSHRHLMPTLSYRPGSDAGPELVPTLKLVRQLK